jgi:4-hydroxybenzoate polyprenyltransferase
MMSIRTFVRLIRAPALPTALSNILMGFLVSRGSWQPHVLLALLLLASGAIYSAGMVLNDVADEGEDRKLRPNRPIPRGEVSTKAARRLGWGLLLAGLLFAIAAGASNGLVVNGQATVVPGVIGLCLVVFVIAYDYWLKQFFVGPMVMGICRLLNVLLGMSLGTVSGDAATFGFSPLQWSIAAGIGAYVIGLSVIARREAGEARRGQIVLGAVLVTVALAWLASLPWWLNDARFEHQTVREKFWALALFPLVFVPVFVRIVRAIASPSGGTLQRAVTSLLFSLVFIDAVLCVTVCRSQPVFAMIVAALIVPAMLLSRWAYAT